VSAKIVLVGCCRRFPRDGALSHRLGYCMRRRNIILSQVTEERTVQASVYNPRNSPTEMLVAKRTLSQALIPGVHLVKVEIAKDTYDAHVAPIIESES